MFRSITVVFLSTVFWANAVCAQETTAYEILPVTDPIPLRYGDAALGDFDLDGDQDLVLSGFAEEDPTPIIGRDAGPLAGYYSNDGITQIDVVNPIGERQTTNALELTRSSGVGQNLIGLWQSTVATHDYDQDGRLDLAMHGLDQDDTPRFYVYGFSESSTFNLTYSLEGLYAGDLSWADLDNDGDVDLVACGRDERGDPAMVQYENTGTMVKRFIALPNQFTGLAECDLAIGDYDTDGDLDLVVAGVTAQDGFKTLVYDNIGGGQLVEASHNFSPYGWSSVSWVDFDVDGDLDLAQTGARITPSLLEGVTAIYRNNSGTFTQEDLLVGAFTNDPTLGRYDGSMDWGDQNNSGYPDMIISGFESPLSSESAQLYISDRGMQFRKFVKCQDSAPPMDPCPQGSFDGGARGVAIWFDHDNDLDLDLFLMGDAPKEGGLSMKVMQSILLSGLAAPSAPQDLRAEVKDQMAILSWGSGTDSRTPEAGLTYNVRVGRTSQGVDVVSPLADVETGRRFISQRGNVDHNRTWTLHHLPSGTYYWSVQVIDQTYAGSVFSEEGIFIIP